MLYCTSLLYVCLWLPTNQLNCMLICLYICLSKCLSNNWQTKQQLLEALITVWHYFPKDEWLQKLINRCCWRNFNLQSKILCLGWHKVKNHSRSVRIFYFPKFFPSHSQLTSNAPHNLSTMTFIDTNQESESSSPEEINNVSKHT